MTIQEKKRLDVAVICARLNHKGQLGLRTWQRVRKAVSIRKSLMRGEAGVLVRYVIVPLPECSDAKSRMLLQLAITQRDEDCDENPILPVLGESLPKQRHIDFVRSTAQQVGADFMIC